MTERIITSSWFSSDRSRVVRQRWRATDTGMELVGDVETVSPAPPDIAPQQGCRGCAGGIGVEVVTWLWLRWYGRPWPVLFWRWWMWFDWPEPKERGCGCLVKLKAITDGIKDTWRRVRVA